MKCSHGATVGQLDDEAKFYLMSRGIPRVAAERLVVLGFLGEVLSRLPLGGVGHKVTRVIEEKLGHEAATGSEPPSSPADQLLTAWNWQPSW